MKFVDIHTHRPKVSQAIQLVDLSNVKGIGSRINFYYSLGVHPWFVNENKLDKELQKIENHMRFSPFLAIGECGLDKICDTDFDLQIKAFEKQIALSEKYKKPLIIHVVKAFNELMQIRVASNVKQTWIVHGFNGSPQLANQLIDLGMYLSFGVKLNKSDTKASKSIGHIPINRLFLESDDSMIEIEAIYSIASERLQIDIDQLKAQLWLNFKSLFL